MTRMSGGQRMPSSKAAPRMKRSGDIVPLCFTYLVVISSWAGFTYFIIIKDALIHRASPVRAGVQLGAPMLLFGLTITSLLIASTRPPGHPDPALTPEGVKEARERNELDKDEDDIPLGRLLKGRRLSLTLESHQHKTSEPQDEDSAPRSGSSGFSPEVSPFPLNISPFVPTSATDAGEDAAEYEDNDVGLEEAADPDLDDEDMAGGDNRDRLLGPAEPGERIENRKSLFAKNSSGGHRWCSKCGTWKPDRCHHCRYCKRCTLKMDHHCIWIGSCVGYHNYTPFLLFVSYGTLLALFIFIESGLSMIHYFTHPNDYTSDSSTGMEVSELTPVSFMLLTFIGGFFTMTIGGLAGYHWYLVWQIPFSRFQDAADDGSNNKTTLEDITHAYPSALIEDQRHSTDRQSEWRGDHLLSRPERVRLRQEASQLNVYDLGWRRNIEDILLGTGRKRKGLFGYFMAFWPLSAHHDRLDAAAGHYFDHDPAKLERLQELTAELRLGRTQRASGHDELDDEHDDDDDDE